MIEDAFELPQAPHRAVRDWIEERACRNAPIEWFFPTRGKSIRKGLECCARCPVKVECYDYAVSTGTSDGVWGGVNFDGRQAHDPLNIARIPTRPKETTMAASSLEQQLEEVTVTPVAPPTKIKNVEATVPRSLSASSIQTYLDCPAKWRALYIDGGKEPSGEFASLGTVCHSTLEDFVINGHHLSADRAQQKDIIRALYGQHYYALFSDPKRFDEGLNLCFDWLKRQDWTDREVLSCEQKMTFTLKVYGPDGTLHEIPFNYIMDRKDRRIRSGDIEVIDYKSLSQPMKADALKRKPQARIYGLGAQIEHPEANRIWVTFDMLRFDAIGIVFTKEENRATWKFLQEVAKRIIADEEYAETLGDGCRYCIRSNVCTTLNAHVKVGGPLSITDPVDAARRKFEIDAAIGGLKSISDALEKVILQHMQEMETFELEVPGLEVKAGVSGRRAADHQPVLDIVGPTIFAEISGNPSIKEIEKLMKDPRLDNEQKSLLGQCIRMNYGDTKVTIKKASPL